MPLFVRSILLLLTLVATLASAGCSPEAESFPSEAPAVDPTTETPADPADRPIEATDLFGRPLYRPVLDEAFRARQEDLLAEAEAVREADPEDLDAWIWVGRRQAYLGRYQDAIATYTEALDALGEHPELYRHRGHRYLTTRQWDLAEADLERAAELFAGREDVVEADGLPNAAGIPTSTLGTNIWYHLGLARYLRGDFEGARLAWNECLELSKNDDMRVATAYWLSLALRRLALDGDAEALLEPFPVDLELLENHAYHRLILLFRDDTVPGVGDREDLLDAAREEGEAAFATTGYGVAMDAWLGDDTTRPAEIWREIVATDAWASFGYLAAEAELHRDGLPPAESSQ